MSYLDKTHSYALLPAAEVLSAAAVTYDSIKEEQAEIRAHIIRKHRESRLFGWLYRRLTDDEIWSHLGISETIDADWHRVGQELTARELQLLARAAHDTHRPSIHVTANDFCAIREVWEKQHGGNV